MRLGVTTDEVGERDWPRSSLIKRVQQSSTNAQAGAGQFVLGTTLDVGNLFSNRIRLRPSAEIGVFNSPNTYVGSLDVLWRFAEDEEVATPYIGAGLAIAGRQGCAADPNCPGLWANLAFGFELHYRSTFNWLMEYRALDVLHRHRVYVGLTTRRGN